MNAVSHIYTRRTFPCAGPVEVPHHISSAMRRQFRSQSLRWHPQCLSGLAGSPNDFELGSIALQTAERLLLSWCHPVPVLFELADGRLTDLRREQRSQGKFCG